MNYESGNFEKCETEKNAFQDLHSENCWKKVSSWYLTGSNRWIFQERTLSPKKTIDFLDLLQWDSPLKRIFFQFKYSSGKNLRNNLFNFIIFEQRQFPRYRASLSATRGRTRSPILGQPAQPMQDRVILLVEVQDIATVVLNLKLCFICFRWSFMEKLSVQATYLLFEELCLPGIFVYKNCVRSIKKKFFHVF